MRIVITRTNNKGWKGNLRTCRTGWLNNDNASIMSEIVRNERPLGYEYIGETRRNGGVGELRTSKGLTLLSGKVNGDDDLEYSVAFFLSDSAKSSLLDWKPISDRIIWAHFNSGRPYAEETKDDFYNALNATFKAIKKKDLDYADDLYLLSHTQRDIRSKLDDLERGICLTPNQHPSKEMRVGVKNRNPLKMRSNLFTLEASCPE
ncbi:unnamed protein product [Pieris macdunnoughi]|uniref:Uncharacterized protein n=1 Tax=Pieris macdunnoughi TaxID=345717 RepID=A0A821P7L9_9NEOP|nr:unnamed protein product [Pieris macdunnoughi]